MNEAEYEARKAFIERYVSEMLQALRETPTHPVTPMAIERGDMRPEDNLFYHVVEVASKDDQLANLLSRALAKMMTYQKVLGDMLPILGDAAKALEHGLAVEMERKGSDAWVDERARLQELAIAESEDYDNE